jgi:NAD(P)-dependent dehydrogenase (short-subunit alcohol dehydrogenase family)
LSTSPRVFLITGANTGIGKVTALEIAKRTDLNPHVILACRNEARGQEAVADIKAACGHDRVELLLLDLADLDHVRSSAQTFLDRDLPLHVLINNAGFAGQRGTTKQGFELHFGVNHLGPFLFSMMLMQRLKDSGSHNHPARVVNVASKAHYRAKTIDLNAQQQLTATKSGFPEYSLSKLANVLFNAELARRINDDPITTFALHPGVVASDIWRSVPRPIRWLMTLGMISNEQGAKTSLHCALDPSVLSQSGLYFDSCKPVTPSKTARDPQLAANLWAKSLEWTGAPDWPR